ncbi:glutathione S-transferase domain containing protein [Nitzschia inconspicua]|uniref:Glutathione S-transferase domain containing protein n=1 Tax=Nitzschia inconspicua TaxID=303405 RepID=A0A9K3PFU3_9STRA|nr:glutathione S-transferase domain containing protein [Nitzschia inconspicua]
MSAMRGDGQMQSMSNTHGDKLVILGFPSREFGGQEFKTDEEIAEFAARKNFPGILMKLGRVTGPGASEIWKFFRKATNAKDPAWNFDGKFLVSKTGVVMLPGGDLEATIANLIEES